MTQANHACTRLGRAWRFECYEALGARQRPPTAVSDQADLTSASLKNTVVNDEPRFSLPDIPDGCEAVRAPMTASVWQIAVEPGQRVGAGERVIVLEAMKMEFIVVAPVDGVVETVHCTRGGMVLAGQNLATLRPNG